MSVVLTETFDHVALITLNRPQAGNAMSPELVVALHDACVQARDDDTIRVVVLAAMGDKAFCSGGDLGLTIPLLTGARKAETDADHRLLSMLSEDNCPLPTQGDIGKPVIAAVEALALGGGLELALAADIIVAGEGAKFGAPEVKAGAYPARLTYLLPDRIPYGKAAEMLMTGSLISSEDALSCHLINHRVAAGTARDKALEIAQKIAANAPISVNAAREVAKASARLPQDTLVRFDMKMAAKVYRSEDAREGPKAFSEKRKPVFKGR